MNTLNTALTWLDAGIGTMPILAGGKTPALRRWKPYQRRLPTRREIGVWFANSYNLAVITGWRNLVVMDWDDVGEYTKWLASLSASKRRLVMGTYQVQTARGLHFYFYLGSEMKTQPGNGVDIKANGGYVLGVPSIHPSGRHYQAIGCIKDIKPIDTITDLLPRPVATRSSWGDRGVEMDPFDAAMCESVDFSQMGKIHSRWRMEDLLPGLPSHRGVRKTRCPFHNDGQASLAVYSDGHSHCFGCGFHARDVVGLYAALHKLSISEAVREMQVR